MIKSPLRYPGGKSKSVDKITSLIPMFDEYREPFLGGGSVFLHLKQKYPNKKFWINDLYFELYKFWEMCQQDVASVVQQVYKWRNEFSNGKELHRFLIDNMASFTDIEKASAFFIFNRYTFSEHNRSRWFLEQAYTAFTLSSIKALPPFAKLLNNTQITNIDYEKNFNHSLLQVASYLTKDSDIGVSFNLPFLQEKRNSKSDKR